jgi:malonyl-CoA O-methyltransferase
MNPVRIPPKYRISKTFGLKALNYEKYAEVQQQFQNILISRIIQEPAEGIWVDLGCGTGLLFNELVKRGWLTRCIGADISHLSIINLKKRLGKQTDGIVADIDHLPLKTSSCRGAIFSSVLQWIENIDLFLGNLNTILEHEGKIFFSIFLSGSFKELSEARSSLNISEPIVLPTISSVEHSLRQNAFKEISLKEYEEIVYFKSARDLLKSLSAIGSTAVSEKPMTRSQLHTFCSLLESSFKTTQGVPLTYRAAVGWAQKA